MFIEDLGMDWNLAIYPKLDEITLRFGIMSCLNLVTPWDVPLLHWLKNLVAMVASERMNTAHRLRDLLPRKDQTILTALPCLCLDFYLLNSNLVFLVNSRLMKGINNISM